MSAAQINAIAADQTGEGAKAPLTLDRARLIVRCSGSYAPATVIDAASWLLANLDATDEDIHEASHAIIDAKQAA